MGDNINMNASEIAPAETVRKDNALVEIADGLLFDAQSNIESRKTISMPIAELATLGAGVSSLLPVFRTVTQTTRMPRI